MRISQLRIISFLSNQFNSPTYFNTLEIESPPTCYHFHVIIRNILSENFPWDLSAHVSSPTGNSSAELYLHNINTVLAITVFLLFFEITCGIVIVLPHSKIVCLILLLTEHAETVFQLVDNSEKRRRPRLANRSSRCCLACEHKAPCKLFFRHCAHSAF